MRPDTPQILRRPPGPPLFLPENGDAADVNNKKHTLPLAQTACRSEGNDPKRTGPVRPDAPQAPRRSPNPPIFLPPENGHAANVDDKNARFPLAQIVRRSEGSAPKRIGPLRPDAPQMPPPGLPPRRFFLPRRREPDTMRTEESERQAKGKRRKRHKRQNGERETGRQETEKTRKTDSPENGFGPAATVCGRAESFEDRRSGQPEPSRFRTLSIGNNRLCKVLRR